MHVSNQPVLCDTLFRLGEIICRPAVEWSDAELAEVGLTAEVVRLLTNATEVLRDRLRAVGGGHWMEVK